MLIQGRAEKTEKDIKQVGKAHSASVLNYRLRGVF